MVGLKSEKKGRAGSWAELPRFRNDCGSLKSVCCGFRKIGKGIVAQFCLLPAAHSSRQHPEQNHWDKLYSG